MNNQALKYIEKQKHSIKWKIKKIVLQKSISRKIEKIRAINFYRTRKQKNPCHKILQHEKIEKNCSIEN